MDLRHLEVLRAVADSGSFTAAGRRLHLSQSAVSRQIQLLEREVDEALFLRIGRKVQITPTGETLLGLSHRVLADIQDTQSMLRERQQTVTGTLRITGGMTVCMYVFPELLKRYRKLFPGVDVHVTTGATPRLIRRLRTGSVDVGLITLPVEDPALVTIPTMREELLLITSPAHPLGRRKRVLPPDLHRLPFVLFEVGSNTRRAIDQFFAREQITPHIIMQTENVEIIKAMVRSGMGVGIVPYQAVAREVKAGHLACARIVGEPLVRETGWVYLRTNRVPRLVQEMMKLLDRVRPRLKLSPPGS
ncbi:MAG: LysR family transcriptional regulator, partial [Acidobacteria bacterium]|nr:LysR family transcriptional regulator [Acidobacteriota bacterium]